MGFDKEDLIDSRIRSSAANKGTLRVFGRYISLKFGGMQYVDEFTYSGKPRRVGLVHFRQGFHQDIGSNDVNINNAMFRIRNPESKYVIKPVNSLMTKESKAPVFLSRRVRLKTKKAAIVCLGMKNYKELVYSKQVCIVPNPNSQIAAILGRSFSITEKGLCVSVFLNSFVRPVTIQRGRKLCYA